MEGLHMHKALAVSAYLACVLFATPAFSDAVSLNATLTAQAEVPASSGSGQGTAHFTYNTDTKQLTYFVRYRDLSGPATAADVHGPASPGATGPSVVHLYSPASPISGNTTLSDSQASDLLNGQYYVEVNTDAHQNGEIRGQIKK
jgi:CHRD domain